MVYLKEYASQNDVITLNIITMLSMLYLLLQVPGMDYISCYISKTVPLS